MLARSRISVRALPRSSRSCVRFNSTPSYSTPAPVTSSYEPNKLARFLAETIKSTGPMTVATYMRQCLTNPEGGYYTTSPTPFGSQGDFVTSPEISQMFGELVGIWILSEWMNQGMKSECAIMEFGPGKGTLMDDALRALSKFKNFMGAVRSVHLVEASPALREVQREKLCGSTPMETVDGAAWSCKSKYGPTIYWHEDIKELPEALPSPFIIAHEFFDALPIHSFERTKQGWREFLVDTIAVRASPIAPPSELPHNPMLISSTKAKDADPVFHLTLSPKQTPHSTTLPHLSTRTSSLPDSSRVEISPDTLSIVHQLALRTAAQGGAQLIVDYGPAETVPVDTLRGIRAHKIVSPWVDPGKADLSADVDFGAIKHAAKEASGELEVHGPVEQGDWLHALGIGARAQALWSAQRDEAGKKRVTSAYERLTGKGLKSMGKIYKVMAVGPKGGKTPVGFGGSV
ncbi:hypothetical protein YB2330_006338 [Saitoella coloradoensis]